MDGLSSTQVLVIAFVWGLNMSISFWNARVVGLAWVETKAVGGWHRFMAWMGATMSAAGFSWCYTIFLAVAAHHFKYIDARALEVSLQLGYVLLVPFILFSGYAITLDSWAEAYRRGGWVNYGAATWNTAASLHNTYSAVRGFGPAFSSVADFFSGSGSKSSSSSSKKQGGQEAVILIAIAAISAGIITTAVIVKSYAGSRQLSREADRQFS